MSPVTTILTGNINSGKTTRMLEWYQRLEPGSGDGIISRKAFKGGSFIGYEAVRLSDDCAKILALQINTGLDRISKAGSTDNSRTTAADGHFGPFRFSQEAFRFAETHLNAIAAKPSIRHIFLDEIGPMEMQGRGFSTSLSKLLRLDRHLILCVRAGCLDAVVKRFQISNPEFVRIS